MTGMRGVFLFVILSFFVTGFSGTAVEKSSQAKAFYDKGEYEKSKTLYLEAQADEPDSKKLSFNIGNTHYKLKDYDQATQNYSSVSESADKELKSKSFYNLGNTVYRLGKIDEAIEKYKDALRVEPMDENAKYNLEFLLKQKEDSQGGGGQERPDKSDQGGDGDQEESQGGGKDSESDRSQKGEREEEDQGEGRSGEEESKEGEGQEEAERRDSSEGEDQDKGRAESKKRQDEREAQPSPEAGEEEAPSPEQERHRSASMKILDALAQDEARHLNLKQQPPEQPGILRDRDW